MRSPGINTIAALLFTAFFLGGCQDPPERQANEQLIAVSILPQQFIVRALLGDDASILVLVPAGASPATYEPVPGDMARLARASAWLRIGHIGFEHSWTDRIHSINPDLPIFDLSEGILLVEGGHGQCDDPGHGHGVDPHVWMSPQQLTIVARNAQDALIEVFPSMEDSLRARHERLQQHLIALDDSLRLILHDSIGRSFAIFHPSLTYLAQDYGLTQLSIEHEGKDPSPQQLKAVIDQIRDKEIQAIFVQKEFNQDHARAIAGAVGIPVVVIDPLSADLDLNILRIARQIAHNH